MLEWETAATTAASREVVEAGLRRFVVDRPATTSAASRRSPSRRGVSCTSRSGAVSPLMGDRAGRLPAGVPVGARVRPLGDRDRTVLRRTARTTWRYFETFVTEADAAAPDNYQGPATLRSWRAAPRPPISA
jgi:cyclic beta-1,2-glucan synthetase